jgi:type I restriction enzyme M protein
VGGVPVAEVVAERLLFGALDFNPAHAFVPRANDARYFDFAPSIAERGALSLLVENDPGVRARVETSRAALSAWWANHTLGLAELPTRRNLNAVRAEVLDTFVAALLPLGLLDRFKLGGVIASRY